MNKSLRKSLKRIVSNVIAAVMLITSVFTSNVSVFADVGELGDVDKNGHIEVNDASLLLQHVLNKKNNWPGKPDATELTQIGDVNGDGFLSSADVSEILKKALEPSFEFSGAGRVTESTTEDANQKVDIAGFVNGGVSKVILYSESGSEISSAAISDNGFSFDNVDKGAYQIGLEMENGYSVSTVKVNGTVVPGTDGKYKFTANSNIRINVTTSFGNVYINGYVDNASRIGEIKLIAPDGTEVIGTFEANDFSFGGASFGKGDYKLIVTPAADCEIAGVSIRNQKIDATAPNSYDFKAENNVELSILTNTTNTHPDNMVEVKGKADANIAEVIFSGDKGSRTMTVDPTTSEYSGSVVKGTTYKVTFLMKDDSYEYADINCEKDGVKETKTTGEKGKVEFTVVVGDTPIDGIDFTSSIDELVEVEVVDANGDNLKTLTLERVDGTINEVIDILEGVGTNKLSLPKGAYIVNATVSNDDQYIVKSITGPNITRSMKDGQFVYTLDISEGASAPPDGKVDIKVTCADKGVRVKGSANGARTVTFTQVGDYKLNNELSPANTYDAFIIEKGEQSSNKKVDFELPSVQRGLIYRIDVDYGYDIEYEIDDVTFLSEASKGGSVDIIKYNGKFFLSLGNPNGEGMADTIEVEIKGRPKLNSAIIRGDASDFKPGETVVLTNAENGMSYTAEIKADGKDADGKAINSYKFDMLIPAGEYTGVVGDTNDPTKYALGKVGESKGVTPEVTVNVLDDGTFKNTFKVTINNDEIKDIEDIDNDGIKDIDMPLTSTQVFANVKFVLPESVQVTMAKRVNETTSDSAVNYNEDVELGSGTVTITTSAPVRVGSYNFLFKVKDKYKEDGANYRFEVGYDDEEDNMLVDLLANEDGNNAQRYLKVDKDVTITVEAIKTQNIISVRMIGDAFKKDSVKLVKGSEEHTHIGEVETFTETTTYDIGNQEDVTVNYTCYLYKFDVPDGEYDVVADPVAPYTKGGLFVGGENDFFNSDKKEVQKVTAGTGVGTAKNYILETNREKLYQSDLTVELSDENTGGKQLDKVTKLTIKYVGPNFIGENATYFEKPASNDNKNKVSKEFKFENIPNGEYEVIVNDGNDEWFKKNYYLADNNSIVPGDKYNYVANGDDPEFTSYGKGDKNKTFIRVGMIKDTEVNKANQWDFKDAKLMITSKELEVTGKVSSIVEFAPKDCKIQLVKVKENEVEISTANTMDPKYESLEVESPKDKGFDIKDVSKTKTLKSDREYDLFIKLKQDPINGYDPKKSESLNLKDLKVTNNDSPIPLTLSNIIETNEGGTSYKVYIFNNAIKTDLRTNSAPEIKFDVEQGARIQIKGKAYRSFEENGTIQQIQIINKAGDVIPTMTCIDPNSGTEILVKDVPLNVADGDYYISSELSSRQKDAEPPKTLRVLREDEMGRALIQPTEVVNGKIAYPITTKPTEDANDGTEAGDPHIIEGYKFAVDDTCVSVEVEAANARTVVLTKIENGKVMADNPYYVYKKTNDETDNGSITEGDYKFIFKNIPAGEYEVSATPNRVNVKDFVVGINGVELKEGIPYKSHVEGHKLIIDGADAKDDDTRIIKLNVTTQDVKDVGRVTIRGDINGIDDVDIRNYDIKVESVDKYSEEIDPSTNKPIEESIGGNITAISQYRTILEDGESVREGSFIIGGLVRGVTYIITVDADGNNDPKTLAPTDPTSDRTIKNIPRMYRQAGAYLPRYSEGKNDDVTNRRVGERFLYTVPLDGPDDIDGFQIDVEKIYRLPVTASTAIEKDSIDFSYRSNESVDKTCDVNFEEVNAAGEYQYEAYIPLVSKPLSYDVTVNCNVLKTGKIALIDEDPNTSKLLECVSKTDAGNKRINQFKVKRADLMADVDKGATAVNPTLKITAEDEGHVVRGVVYNGAVPAKGGTVEINTKTGIKTADIDKNGEYILSNVIFDEDKTDTITVYGVDNTTKMDIISLTQKDKNNQPVDEANDVFEISEGLYKMTSLNDNIVVDIVYDRVLNRAIVEGSVKISNKEPYAGNNGVIGHMVLVNIDPNAPETHKKFEADIDEKGVVTFKNVPTGTFNIGHIECVKDADGKCVKGEKGYQYVDKTSNPKINMGKLEVVKGYRITNMIGAGITYNKGTNATENEDVGSISVAVVNSNQINFNINVEKYLYRLTGTVNGVDTIKITPVEKVEGETVVETDTDGTTLTYDVYADDTSPEAPKAVTIKTKADPKDTTADPTKPAYNRSFKSLAEFDSEKYYKVEVEALADYTDLVDSEVDGIDTEGLTKPIAEEARIKFGTGTKKCWIVKFDGFTAPPGYIGGTTVPPVDTNVKIHAKYKGACLINDYGVYRNFDESKYSGFYVKRDSNNKLVPYLKGKDEKVEDATATNSTFDKSILTGVSVDFYGKGEDANPIENGDLKSDVTPKYTRSTEIKPGSFDDFEVDADEGHLVVNLKHKVGYKIKKVVFAADDDSQVILDGEADSSKVIKVDEGKDYYSCYVDLNKKYTDTYVHNRWKVFVFAEDVSYEISGGTIVGGHVQKLAYNWMSFGEVAKNENPSDKWNIIGNKELIKPEENAEEFEWPTPDQKVDQVFNIHGDETQNIKEVKSIPNNGALLIEPVLDNGYGIKSVVVKIGDDVVGKIDSAAPTKSIMLLLGPEFATKGDNGMNITITTGEVTGAVTLDGYASVAAISEVALRPVNQDYNDDSKCYFSNVTDDHFNFNAVQPGEYYITWRKVKDGLQELLGKDDRDKLDEVTLLDDNRMDADQSWNNMYLVPNLKITLDKGETLDAVKITIPSTEDPNFKVIKPDSDDIRIRSAWKDVTISGIVYDDAEIISTTEELKLEECTIDEDGTAKVKAVKDGGKLYTTKLEANSGTFEFMDEVNDVVQKIETGRKYLITIPYSKADPNKLITGMTAHFGDENSSATESGNAITDQYKDKYGNKAYVLDLTYDNLYRKADEIYDFTITTGNKTYNISSAEGAISNEITKVIFTPAVHLSETEGNKVDYTNYKPDAEKRPTEVNVNGKLEDTELDAGTYIIECEPKTFTSGNVITDMGGKNGYAKVFVDYYTDRDGKNKSMWILELVDNIDDFSIATNKLEDGVYVDVDVEMPVESTTDKDNNIVYSLVSDFTVKLVKDGVAEPVAKKEFKKTETSISSDIINAGKAKLEFLWPNVPVDDYEIQVSNDADGRVYAVGPMTKRMNTVDKGSIPIKPDENGKYSLKLNNYNGLPNKEIKGLKLDLVIEANKSADIPASQLKFTINPIDSNEKTVTSGDLFDEAKDSDTKTSGTITDSKGKVVANLEITGNDVKVKPVKGVTPYANAKFTIKVNDFKKLKYCVAQIKDTDDEEVIVENAADGYSRVKYAITPSADKTSGTLEFFKETVDGTLSDTDVKPINDAIKINVRRNNADVKFALDTTDTVGLNAVSMIKLIPVTVDDKKGVITKVESDSEMTSSLIELAEEASFTGVPSGKYMVEMTINNPSGQPGTYRATLKKKNTSADPDAPPYVDFETSDTLVKTYTYNYMDGEEQKSKTVNVLTVAGENDIDEKDLKIFETLGNTASAKNAVGYVINNTNQKGLEVKCNSIELIHVPVAGEENKGTVKGTFADETKKTITFGSVPQGTWMFKPVADVNPDEDPNADKSGFKPRMGYKLVVKGRASSSAGDNLTDLTADKDGYYKIYVPNTIDSTECRIVEFEAAVVGNTVTVTNSGNAAISSVVVSDENDRPITPVISPSINGKVFTIKNLSPGKYYLAITSALGSGKIFEASKTTGTGNAWSADLSYNYEKDKYLLEIEGEEQDDIALSCNEIGKYKAEGGKVALVKPLEESPSEVVSNVVISYVDPEDADNTIDFAKGAVGTNKAISWTGETTGETNHEDRVFDPNVEYTISVNANSGYNYTMQNKVSVGIMKDGKFVEKGTIDLTATEDDPDEYVAKFTPSNFKFGPELYFNIEYGVKNSADIIELATELESILTEDFTVEEATKAEPGAAKGEKYYRIDKPLDLSRLLKLEGTGANATASDYWITSTDDQFGTYFEGIYGSLNGPCTNDSTVMSIDIHYMYKPVDETSGRAEAGISTYVESEKLNEDGDELVEGKKTIKVKVLKTAYNKNVPLSNKVNRDLVGIASTNPFFAKLVAEDNEKGKVFEYSNRQYTQANPNAPYIVEENPGGVMTETVTELGLNLENGNSVYAVSFDAKKTETGEFDILLDGYGGLKYGAEDGITPIEDMTEYATMDDTNYDGTDDYTYTGSGYKPTKDMSEYKDDTTWRAFKLIIKGNHVDLYIDGKYVTSYKNNASPSEITGLSVRADNGDTDSAIRIANVEVAPVVDSTEMATYETNFESIMDVKEDGTGGKVLDAKITGGEVKPPIGADDVAAGIDRIFDFRPTLKVYPHDVDEADFDTEDPTRTDEGATEIQLDLPARTDKSEIIDWSYVVKAQEDQGAYTPVKSITKVNEDTVSVVFNAPVEGTGYSDALKNSNVIVELYASVYEKRIQREHENRTPNGDTYDSPFTAGYVKFYTIKLTKSEPINTKLPKPAEDSGAVAASYSEKSAQRLDVSDSETIETNETVPPSLDKDNALDVADETDKVVDGNETADEAVDEMAAADEAVDETAAADEAVDETAAAGEPVDEAVAADEAVDEMADEPVDETAGEPVDEAADEEIAE